MTDDETGPPEASSRLERMRPALHPFFSSALVTVAYVAAGSAGISLAGALGNVSAVWLPSGIALAAVLILGRGIWPGVLVGAAVANAIYYTRESAPLFELVGASVGIGIGSTLQALAGGALVQHFAGGVDALAAPRRVGAMMACAALACVVASTFGTALLLAFGRVELAQLARAWVTWWLGDAVGVLMVLPLALAWHRGVSFEASAIERAAHALVLFAVIEVLFAPIGIGPGIDAPYVLLPVFVGIAYRLGPRDASLAAFAAWAGVVVAIARGEAPLGERPPESALLAADALFVALAMPTLFLASVEWARRRTERELKAFGEELETRVTARTHELQLANAELAGEVDRRARTEARLRESEARLHTAIESLPFDFWILDADERYVLLNSTAKAHWGDRTGQRVAEIDLPEDVLAHWRANNARAFAGEVVVQPVEYEHEGARRTFEAILAPIRVDGRIAGVLGVNVDVTERVRLTEQIVRSQKIEAVGRIAGGIAHDFNNMLTVVGGAAEALQRRLEAGSLEAELIGNIREASQQAAELTRRLLLFAGRQPGDERVAALDELLGPALALLRPLLPESVEIEIERGSSRAVRLDPTRLGQVVVNLALNARDAMPDGGTFSIRTADVEVAESDSEGWVDERAKPGPHAVLEVRDTGHGMSESVRALAFEPFFSTKGAARGTGLGLASVLGIVRQAGGAIALESAPGQGTTFRVFFPEAEPQPERHLVRGATMARVARARRGVVLLVEDDEPVRRTLERMLRDVGHEVIVAADPASARAIAAREHFDVLVSDVVMPGTSGPALARELRRARPDLPVLFLSAYAERDTEGLDAPLLPKPCTADALARAVDALLPASVGDHPDESS